MKDTWNNRNRRVIRRGDGWTQFGYEGADDHGYASWIEADSGETICFVGIDGLVTFASPTDRKRDASNEQDQG